MRQERAYGPYFVRRLETNHIENRTKGRFGRLLGNKLEAVTFSVRSPLLLIKAL
jgi:hypothetical protein